MTTSSTKPRKRAAKDSGNGSVGKLARGPARRGEREFRVVAGPGEIVIRTSLTDDGLFVAAAEVVWRGDVPSDLPEVQLSVGDMLECRRLVGAVEQAVEEVQRELAAWLKQHQHDQACWKAYALVDDLHIALGDWDFLAAIGMEDTRGLTPPGSPEADPRSAPAGQVGVFRKTGEVVEISLDDCATLAANPVPDPVEVQRIADSFRWRGQDEPIIVLPRSQATHTALPATLRPKQTDYLYLVLAGATRLAAAATCGWSKIQARVRDEAMEAEEILAFAFRNNTDRRVVTTAEKAAYAAAIAETLPDGPGRDDAVAQQMGLDRSEVNQLLRFVRLPQVWRDRVARFERDASDPDSISWTCAKAFLPYVDLPAVMAAIEETWTDDIEVGESSELARKNSVRDRLRWIVLQATRPLDKSDKNQHDYGWQNGGYQPRLYPLTDELRERLAIVTIRDGDETLERITNVELNDKLQEPYLQKLVEKGIGGVRPKAAKPAPNDPKLSPAEQARADAAKAKEQDRELTDRIQRPGGLREQALRWSMANAFGSPGDLTDGCFHALIAAVAQNDYGSPIDWREWQCEAIRMLWSQRDATGKSVPKSGVARSRLDHHSLLVDYAVKTGQTASIAAAQVRQMLVRMILFPQQPAKAESHLLAPADTWPDRWPVIPGDVLEYWARAAGATVMETWKVGEADPNSSSWQWFDRFIAAHNRRQLQALARQCGQESQLKGAKTLAEERQRMVLLHADQLLPLPSVLQFEAVPSKKKGGKR